MFINNEIEAVNPHNLVSEETILATVYEIYPHIVFTQLLSYDFFNYISSIPEHCNGILLQAVESNFNHLITNNFIEVVGDASFDYDYGDISSTHHDTYQVGYVPRTPEFEAIATEDWDEEYFWY